jgi:hypothetical protein
MSIVRRGRVMRALLRRIPIGRRQVRKDIEPPEFSGTGSGRRVLIEEEDSVLRRAMAGALTEAGFETAECAGPGAHGDGRCPLVEGQGCDAVDHADAVLQVVVASDEQMKEVREAIREHDPDQPISVIVPGPTAARRPDLVAGTTVSTEPLTREGVVAAVRKSLGLS